MGLLGHLGRDERTVNVPTYAFCANPCRPCVPTYGQQNSTEYCATGAVYRKDLRGVPTVPTLIL